MQVLLTPGLRIDFTSNEIHRQGETFRLEPRQMAVLRILLDHRNEVVSRADLVAAVWGDYGGGDEALTQAISHLRKALGDDRKTLLTTLPKRGYRLKGTVPERHRPVTTRLPRGVWLLLIALGLTLAAFALWRWTADAPAEAPPAPDGLERETEMGEVPAAEG